VETVKVFTVLESSDFLLSNFAPGGAGAIFADCVSEGMLQGGEEVTAGPVHGVFNHFGGSSNSGFALGGVQVKES